MSDLLKSLFNDSLVIVRCVIKKLTSWHGPMWQWKFISTWYVLFFLWVIFQVQDLVAHFVLLLALFWVKQCKKLRFGQEWESEIVNPLVTIATILQHCKQSVLFQNIPAPFHQLQRYWGMLSLSTNFLFHRPINTSVTASCGFQKDIKGEKHSSGVCLSKFVVKVETSIRKN